MTYREFHYRWEWHLHASPEALWPLVADTNRFGQDTRLPSIERRASVTPLTNGRRRLRLFRFGIPVEWIEQPFEWIRPHRFGVLRTYTRGPIAQMRTFVELAADSDGTQLVYQVWARPRNVLGLAAIPIQIGLISARNFDAAFRQYDALAAQGKLPLDLPADARFAPGGRERLTTLQKQLADQGTAPDLVRRLAYVVKQADDLTLARLRPYVLADYWSVPRRSVLELCLRATRAGLLEFQWDLLCPMCRGAGESSKTLREVHQTVHCPSCNIDYSVNFEHQVELTFRPNPAIRPIKVREFCVGGPQVTPHIVAQQLLAPGEQRALSLSLEPGRYRLRAPGLPGSQSFSVTHDGHAEMVFRAEASGWPGQETLIVPAPALKLENATQSEQLVIVERMAWSDQAATAAEVTALQTFRDLFAHEALRPGERISVGSLAVLFTDLRGSTRLYREIGDAPAFGRVMDHFDVLREAIAAHEGAIVKTIGDAVMAVFRRPANALRAMLQAQHALAMPPNDKLPLTLKAGVHYGPCIAVTLNERLDYFGSTVNLAARLETLSSGQDVIISDAVRADPEVAAWLAQGELIAEPIEARLKGFEEERLDLWRIHKSTR